MIRFEKETVRARFAQPPGGQVEATIEIRVNPITGRTSRIAFSRAGEREAATDSFPDPPPFAGDTAYCPFCSINLPAKTPQLLKTYEASGRMIRGASVLFPNLFPYGAHSAVSLFDDRHFVEIGTASVNSYTNSFFNCAEYLRRVLVQDPEAVYMAITQNHLPSAGGSLLHPHFQIQADRIASNHQRFLKERALKHFMETGSLLLSDYLQREKEHSQRYIGATGAWEWVAAFAPEGFFEIWGILPQVTSLPQVAAGAWADLAQGVINTQRYYRSLNRNGYNLGILVIEEEASKLEVRVVILARSNYAPWVRSDHTGFEVMLGDMATFTAPEDTATAARPFWTQPESNLWFSSPPSQ
ncbi:MAG: galactose-1-phosphate uridylyltransferase [Deltaproteobacteria bacterium]|nr:galactose-1-phosphate uridylyltransferase [Deltaproteobacteria bacterium]